MPKEGSITRAAEGATRAMAVAAGIILIVMMIHVSADVIAVRVFNSPLPGTLEIVSAHYMVLAVFLPLGFVEYARRSIAVDLLFQLLPRGIRLGLILMILALLVVVYAALAWRTGGDAWEAFERREYLMGGTVQVSTWQSHFALPFGFAAAGLIALLQLVRFVTGADRASWLTHQPDDDIAPE